MYKDGVYINKTDNSHYIYNTCLSIPSSTSITDEDLAIVVREIKEAIG
jgi:dTDP-4-amino-4,6-dideoxygalactose transaminase